MKYGITNQSSKIINVLQLNCFGLLFDIHYVCSSTADGLHSLRIVVVAVLFYHSHSFINTLLNFLDCVKLDAATSGWPR